MKFREAVIIGKSFWDKFWDLLWDDMINSWKEKSEVKTEAEVLLRESEIYRNWRE